MPDSSPNLSVEAFLQELCNTLKTVYNIPEERQDVLPVNVSSLKNMEFTLVGDEAVTKTMAIVKFKDTQRSDIVCVFKITKVPTPAKPFFHRTIILPVDAPPSVKFQNKKIELNKVGS